MLCLSGFELYPSWVPLAILHLHYLLIPQQKQISVARGSYRHMT